jgi:hypothetical protein
LIFGCNVHQTLKNTGKTSITGRKLFHGNDEDAWNNSQTYKTPNAVKDRIIIDDVTTSYPF